MALSENTFDTPVLGSAFFRHFERVYIIFFCQSCPPYMQFSLLLVLVIIYLFSVVRISCKTFDKIYFHQV